jgi:hypothetical protein
MHEIQTPTQAQAVDIDIEQVLEQYLRQYPAEGIMAAACRVGRLALQLAGRLAHAGDRD